MTKIVVHPGFDAFYYSFYYEGLRTVFGEKNIQFSYKPFPSLPPDCMAFIIEGPSRKKILIDAYDGANITNFAGLDWCDIHGKVNLVSSIVPEEYRKKSVAIGPSFPVRIWSWLRTGWLSIRNYGFNVHGVRGVRLHLANYRWQYKFRLPLNDFTPGTSLDNYIFFSSTIWTEEEAPGTNQRRAIFLDVCKSIKQLSFEGGFSPTAVPDLASRYGMHFASKRFSLHQWLDNTRRSAVVFYTPAVWLSHTFKLAEFLALGKAIISTAISRDLPAPLIHGTHVHFVDDSPESYRDAIELILKDVAYRAFLEKNAREYYLDNLTPERVIYRLLSHDSKQS